MRLKHFFANFIKIFFGYLVVLLVFVSIGVSYGLWSQQQMRQESQQFVNITMLGLLAGWDDNEFLGHIAPELQNHTTEEQLRDIKRGFANLGGLLNYHGAQGGLFRTGQWWWQVVARYQVQASFQRGGFSAEIVLVKQQGKWIIGSFEYEYSLFPIAPQLGSLKPV
jgi:hypothetical protein